MPATHLRIPALPADLAEHLAALRAELDVPDDFPAEVLAAAERAAASGPAPTDASTVDRSDLELITLDPPGSRDLDQAVGIEAHGDGFVVWYAIADVASFVTAGGPIDAEARRRGLTLYAPDRRTPLHPPALSERAASLLEGQVRPACLWRLGVDAAGGLTSAEVVRARVRSRAQLSYDEADRRLADGTAGPLLERLAAVGRLREQQEIDRGGVSLDLPEQQIDTTGDSWRLSYRTPLPIEGWNAQISLLTGIAAAGMMLHGGIGLLRTLPPASEEAVRRLRQTARALGIEWPADLTYPGFVRSLDPGRPADAAMLNACTTLFRGAGYVAFDGERPEQVEHAALATPYAHTTAPLRRLIDRWSLEICLALSAGRPVPNWVRESLDTLPALMTEADRRAKAYERAIVDLVEALRMRPLVGQRFDGVIVDVDDDRRRGRVVIGAHAVEATVRGTDLPLGQQVAVRLVTADPATSTVAFELDGAPDAPGPDHDQERR